MRRILMIVFHFPPFSGSSGVQRSLRFVRHLPEFGWEPIVLTASPRAYEQTSDDLLAEIPPGVVVERAAAWDCARHFSIRGRYLACMARPDRWVSWRLAAVGAGMRLIERYRPAALWSTYPIPTAHVIAGILQKRSGLPWIADFRDPMTISGFPPDPKTRAQYQRIEVQTVQQARYSVFTTPGAARDCRERNPALAGRIAVVENGYDEESFAALGPALRRQDALVPGAVTLLHSGIVYRYGRDPAALFDALRRLFESGRLHPREIRLRFRAPLQDDFLQAQAVRYGVAESVEILPSIPYREALAEMMRADALLLLQDSLFNDSIPAKVYEYLRAGRPILAVTDVAGETAGILRAAGLDDAITPDSPGDIVQALVGLLAGLRAGTSRLPRREVVENASRRGRTAALAALVDKAVQPAFPAFRFDDPGRESVPLVEAAKSPRGIPL